MPSLQVSTVSSRTLYNKHVHIGAVLVGVGVANMSSGDSVNPRYITPYTPYSEFFDSHDGNGIVD